MTGIVLLLYVAIGIGCGLIRLSAIAVGILAVIPAVVGAYAASEDGALSMVVAALVPLIVIEGVYFLTMLIVGKFQSAGPVAEKAETREHAAGDLHFRRKPHVGEEP